MININIERIIKTMVDILLISIGYLIINGYLSGNFETIFNFINYASTIFIDSILIAMGILLVIKILKYLLDKLS